jgi:hypothetical protein
MDRAARVVAEAKTRDLTSVEAVEGNTNSEETLDTTGNTSLKAWVL